MSTMNMQKTSGQVEWCLKNKIGTRSDDNVLTLSVWKNFHPEAFKGMIKRCLSMLEMPVPYEIMHFSMMMDDLPTAEACSRARRRLNEKGLYLPEAGTINNRRRKELEMHEWAMSDKDHL